MIPTNALARQVGLRVGPLVLETLVKHYLDRVKKDKESKLGTQLRQDDILYDEVFTIVKAFLDAASLHTVEEVQAFANVRTPSPPWVRVVRLLVPMACCEEAAIYLIKALGGEDVARRVVGGVKWWQVRGINGVDGEWIAAKKDWEEAKRRYKMQQKDSEKGKTEETAADGADDLTNETCSYDSDMDEMRCILYAHGGGYYFGSVDQERYSIQRYARKINGRVFAINYRLAPQYPFPCALQDLIAAYLYLIKPPPEAKHRPVKPAHIIVAGDSAGGGITLALLQVIRDTGLPMPAGGVLISPWCDLTHSFPSIHKNTPTDVIPAHGLSFQKPSTLWPPPSDELTNRVHASLRDRIRKTLRMDDHYDPTATMLSEISIASPTTPVNVGATTSLPSVDARDNQKVTLTTQNGEVITITDQLQLYAPNSNLIHPLVSPGLSYLGGLPPLLFIASDKEVLRDEIIYSAHKAAYPDRFPVKDEVRALYPHLDGIQSRHKPTPVHLQVYDDTAHVLPLLFSFTTPAKFCYRAVATFCRHVTGMSQVVPPVPVGPTLPSINLRPEKSFSSLFARRKDVSSSVYSNVSATTTTTTVAEPPPAATSAQPITSSPPPRSGRNESLKSRSKSTGSPSRKGLGRRLSENLGSRRLFSSSSSRPGSSAGKVEERPPLPSSSTGLAISLADSPHISIKHTESPTRLTADSIPDPIRYAGDPSVYSQFPDGWKEGMIRERVSTEGVIRTLEPESELEAMLVPHEIIGSVSELVVRRYIKARERFHGKFSSTFKAIDKDRRHHLERSQKEIPSDRVVKEGLLPSSGSWTWAWVLDGKERPPPSSIVARRDTGEARRLARVADMAVGQEENVLSGNNLWQVMVNFLSAERAAKAGENESRLTDEENTGEPRRSKLSRFKMKQ